MDVVADNVRIPMPEEYRNSAQSALPQHAGADGEFTMRQAVALTGVGAHALRFYERMSLLAPVPRQSSSGHRRYTLSHISTIETLACLRAAGMPLTQMREYLDLVPKKAEAAPEALSILAAQRTALEAQMRALQERLAYLDHKIAYWQAVEAHDDQAVDTLGRQFANRLRASSRGLSTYPQDHKKKNVR